MPTILAPAIPGNDWEPLIWDRPPVDQAFTASDGSVFNRATAGYAVVQDRVTGDIWNGSAMVAATPNAWATYAIVGTYEGHGSIRVTVPFATMPEAQFLVMIYGQRDSTPAATDRLIRAFKVNSFTNASANPAGVVIGSDYGGTNVMRVVDPTGRPIEGAEVRATATFPGGVADRGRAKTDKEGRWNLNLVCEPGRQHDITFIMPGYGDVVVSLTPEGNA